MNKDFRDFSRHNYKKKRAKLNSINNKVLLMIIGFGVVVLAGAYWYYPKRSKSQPKDVSAITYSTNSPDESKPNAEKYRWNGAPEEPKKIIISSIGVDAYIQKVGVDQKKQVAVPNNVHLAGWFADSQKPGQNGLSIIAGHVSGKTTDGIFKNLKNVKQGEELQIELGNGEVKHYKVIEVKQIKESESSNYLFSQNPKIKSQLNIVTCGGSFNKSTNQYDDRVIISGELQL